MQYLMLVCVNDEVPPSTSEPEPNDAVDWVEEMDGRGVRVMGQRTRPASMATTVRKRNGEVLVTDGPFAETKEWIAGFDVLDCADLDEAIEIASKHPVALVGALELRPFWPFDE